MVAVLLLCEVEEEPMREIVFHPADVWLEASACVIDLHGP